MIARVSYRQAQRSVNRLGIYVDDRRLWSEVGHVRRLLRYYGCYAAETEVPFRSWQALPDLALLANKWHRHGGRSFWHWMVFVREHGRSMVLDSKQSLKQHVRTDFGRMKPNWYVSIQRDGMGQ